MKKIFIKQGNFKIILLISLVIFLSTVLITQTKKGSDTSKGNIILHEDFPNIPSYPGSKIISNNNTYEDDFLIYNATWQTEDNVSAVTKWYINSLQSDGWDIIMTSADPNDETVQLLAATKDNLNLQLSVNRNESIGITSIVVDFPPGENKDEK